LILQTIVNHIAALIKASRPNVSSRDTAELFTQEHFAEVTTIHLGSLALFLKFFLSHQIHSLLDQSSLGELARLEHPFLPAAILIAFASLKAPGGAEMPQVSHIHILLEGEHKEVTISAAQAVVVAEEIALSHGIYLFLRGLALFLFTVLL
jgi:hypothetical protein